MKTEEIYERLEQAYFSDAPHEQEVLDRLPRLLGDAKLFVDIGASLGQYSRAAARALTGATIWAIEADPIRFARLEENCALWESETGNRLFARHAAVAEKPGRITFHVTNSDISGRLEPAELDQKGNPADWEAVEVDAWTLDDAPFEGTPDFVKMDVEGAELSVLRGAPALLARGKTDFQIELHPWGDPQGVIDLMKANGYLGLPYFGEWYFTRSRRKLALAAWLARQDMARRIAGKVKRRIGRVLGRG